MEILANRYFIDGKDFWTIFGVAVESGSDGFLKYPAKKDSITHDWSDSDGVDVDLSSVYFKSRDITLNCSILADNEAAFWNNYNAFIAQWATPGAHRVEIREFGYRSFYCFYKETVSFTRYTRLKKLQGRIAAKFSLRITESEPQVSRSDLFIVTQDGKFLIA
ncbi:MAG TPA: hypothetical protein PL085_11530 [Agriterribacter sp.]|uniref:hypothetical protein n=1 Tax=Agriterribacter sp. TaxID=2821509 RepID=UPI002C80094A|nr:hypothetical protein [Agriterribacter sp.]HRQ17700.1 hypothetical protein [Agriterribacter sp.]